MIAKRKAIGEVVAALVLIFIASITGILLFTISLRTSSAQANTLRAQLVDEGDSAMERFRLIHVTKSGETITLWVYNYGMIGVKIIDVYVNGVRTSFYASGGESVNTGDLEKLTVSIPSEVSGPEYMISLISSRGVKNVTKWVI
jgi:superfamily II DNA or RNA helicase